jgi:hypothetical protein
MGDARESLISAASNHTQPSLGKRVGDLLRMIAIGLGVAEKDVLRGGHRSHSISKRLVGAASFV